MTSGTHAQNFPESEMTLTPDAAAALERGHKLAVVTDDDDDALAATRTLAARLAAAHGLDVVLYDRSEETWMDHPHPSGPYRRDELDGRQRRHLREQLAEFERAGVDAVAWIATVPSITEIVDVVTDLDVDTILLPEVTEHPKLLDRLKAESPAKVVEQMVGLDLHSSTAVLVFDGDQVTIEPPPVP